MERWTEPHLLVLTRGRPEESVLLVCKTHDGGYTSNVGDQCGWKDGIQGVCIGVTGT
jgi:hypothetical protein